MNLVPATGTDIAWFCGLLQAGDTFYPTGGYAHSYGLEGLVQAGVLRDAETLEQFFTQSVLPSLARAELPVVALAWRALGAPIVWAEVGEICILASALKTTREVRVASANVGRQRVELLARLRPGTLATVLLERVEAEAWPLTPGVAAALEGRVHGAPLSAVLGGVYYATISGQLAAAMKLLRIGQNAAQTILTAMLGQAAAVEAQAMAVTREEIGWFNPWVDIASARHERAEARMFIS